MTIIPLSVGAHSVRVLQERAAPIYQGCYDLTHDNVVHIEALDPIDPSDCASVCSTYGSIDLGINAQFCACFDAAPTIAKTYNSSACSWPCDSPYQDYSCGGMDTSTLDDLYSYYVAFGSTTSSSSGSIVSSTTSSRSTATSIASSFGQSSSLITNWPSSSIVSATATLSSEASLTSSSPPSTLTGASGPVATTVTLPVGVYFDISLSAWVASQDSVYYWLSSPDFNPFLADIEGGKWLHLDPDTAQSFNGFTPPFLAGTTWLVHVTVEHPYGSVSLFDVEIIVNDRSNTTTHASNTLQVSYQAADSLSTPTAASTTKLCQENATSSTDIITATITNKYSMPSNAAIRLSSLLSSMSATSSLAIPVATGATSASSVKDGINGLDLGVSTSSAAALAAATSTTEETPVETVQTLVSHDLLDIPLGQYLQNATEDKVDSWAVTPSIAGYNSDWILFDTDNATLFGMVPRTERNVTLLVTVSCASPSQNLTYFLGVKLIITGQRSSLSPASFSTSSSTFSGRNFTATRISPYTAPTPYWQQKNSTSVWNRTAVKESPTALSSQYDSGNSASILPPHLITRNATTSVTTTSMPVFTITLWGTATAYYKPCPTCPSEATVVSISTGATTIPVEVFKTNTPEATVTVTDLETGSQASTTTTKSNNTVGIMETQTRVAPTTVLASQETGKASSGRSVPVVTSTVSSSFDNGSESTGILVRVSVWVLVSMPVVVVLGMEFWVI